MQIFIYVFRGKKLLARRRQREPAVEICNSNNCRGARATARAATSLAGGHLGPRAPSSGGSQPVADSPVFDGVIIISSLERPRPPAVRRLRPPHNPRNIKNRGRT